MRKASRNDFVIKIDGNISKLGFTNDMNLAEANKTDLIRNTKNLVEEEKEVGLIVNG